MITLRGFVEVWCDADIENERGENITFKAEDIVLLKSIKIKTADSTRYDDLGRSLGRPLIYCRIIYLRGLNLPVLIYSNDIKEIEVDE